MEKIKGLDSLRAFAVCAVIIQHWGPVFRRDTPRAFFMQQFFVPSGATGVYIFFALSGFLITSILVNARAESARANLPVIKNFFVRRVLRIFPIYYLTILALYLFTNEITEYLPYLLTYTLNILSYNKNQFLSSFSHSWTLDIEEQFYLVWPWLILFVNRKYLKAVLIGSIVAGMTSCFISMELNHKIEPFHMFDCMDAFGLGGLYAYARTDINACKRFERFIRIAVPISIAACIYWRLMEYIERPAYGISLNKTALSIITIWLIMGAINNRSEIMRRLVLENKVFNFIGKISYGIYIIHPYIVRINGPIMIFMSKHGKSISEVALYIIDLGLLFLVCWLSFVLIETPILKLKRFFDYDRPTAVAS